MMDITESTGNWRVTARQVENRKTGEIRQVANIPQDHSIAMMNESTFQQKCKVAFATGQWPR